MSKRERAVAEKIMTLVSDVSLDLDKVGELIGETLPRVRYNRLKIVMESADEAKEDWDKRNARANW